MEHIEKLVQNGVEMDKKDYFSIIISSLSYALSNYISSQLAAAQYLLLKKITPNNLLLMFLKESNYQWVQFLLELPLGNHAG